jgi:hypothetical protein
MFKIYILIGFLAFFAGMVIMTLIFRRKNPRQMPWVLDLAFRIWEERKDQSRSGGMNFINYPEREKAIKQEISSYLRRYRELSGLTLRDVSAMTQISASTISRIEQGKECKLSSINKLIEFYGITENAAKIAVTTAVEQELFKPHTMNQEYEQK